MHSFLLVTNVSGGVVQNEDSNRTQIPGGDWLVDFLKKSNEFEDEQNWTKRELLIQLLGTIPNLIQMELLDQLIKIYQEIYEVRGKQYNQFLSVVPYICQKVLLHHFVFQIVCLLGARFRDANWLCAIA